MLNHNEPFLQEYEQHYTPDIIKDNISATNSKRILPKRSSGKCKSCDCLFRSEYNQFKGDLTVLDDIFIYKYSQNGLEIPQEELEYYYQKSTDQFQSTFLHKFIHNVYGKVILVIYNNFLAIYESETNIRSERTIKYRNRIEGAKYSQAVLKNQKGSLLQVFSLDTCYISLKEPYQTKENLYCLHIYEYNGEENIFLCDSEVAAKDFIKELMIYGIGIDYFKYYRNIKMLEHYDDFNVYQAVDCDLKMQKCSKVFSKSKLVEADILAIMKEVFILKRIKNIDGLNQLIIKFHKVFETNGSFISVFTDFSDTIDVEEYMQQEGCTIGTILTLWSEILLALQLMKNYDIYLTSDFNFSFFRLKKISDEKYRLIVIDLRYFEEINKKSIDSYEMTQLYSVKSIAVKFENSIQLIEPYSDYSKFKRKFTDICFKVTTGKYENFEKIVKKFWNIRTLNRFKRKKDRRSGGRVALFNALVPENLIDESYIKEDIDDNNPSLSQ